MMRESPKLLCLDITSDYEYDRDQIEWKAILHSISGELYDTTRYLLCNLDDHHNDRDGPEYLYRLGEYETTPVIHYEGERPSNAEQITSDLISRVRDIFMGTDPATEKTKLVDGRRYYRALHDML